MIKFLIQLLLELGLLCSLFFNVFVSKSINTGIVLLELLIFLILMIFLNKYKKPIGRGKYDILFIIVGLTLVLQGTFYLIGFFSGFSISYSQIFKNYITTWMWVKIFLIAILVEIVRYVLTLTRSKKKVYDYILQGIMLISFVLVDVAMATKTYSLTSFNQLYEFFALVVVQSISKNLLFNFISKKYGYTPCIVYRFIVDLYFYFLPITPKINVFIKGVLLLVFPYIVYVFIRAIMERSAPGPSRKKERDGVPTFVFVVIFATLVALVSREFTYCMIGIGSGSMTGTINKGDAIVYKKYDKEDTLESHQLKEGDVIVFYKNNTMIVHRIYKVISQNGEDAYRTKGDANVSVDNWVVSKSDVIGVVQFRVLYIAWPSVLLGEIF